GATGGAPTETLQGLDGLVAADTVGRQADVALELLEGTSRQRTEDPIDAAGVESKPAETLLQGDDVVTAQVRRPVIEGAVTEAPACLDQCRPRLLVAPPVAAQAACALERSNGSFGGVAKRARLAAIDCEAGGSEAALEISYCVSRVPRPQREAVPRNSF